MRFPFAIAFLLAFTSTVLGTHVQINNFCSSPVYLWTTGDSTSAMSTVAAHGGRYSAPYTHRGGGGGISVKLSRAPTLWKPGTTVSQLEYTADPGQPLWYDLSNVDGNAFRDARVVLTPQAAWTGSCKPVDCPPGETCRAAYTHPKDDWATHACPEGTVLNLDLCVH